MSDTETEVAAASASESAPTSSESTSSSSAPAAGETMRDTLSRAFDEAEAEATGPADGTKPTGQRARDNSGRFSATPKPKPGAKSETKAPQSSSTTSLAAPAPIQGQPEPKDKPQAPAAKAPASWKPLAREKWAGLPSEVQQEVLRVDQEVRKVMQGAAQATQTAQSLQQVLAPYEAMIRAERAEPLQAIGSLLQTASALRTLPPWPKHQLMANILTTHGVDLEMLSKALAGTQPDAQQLAAQPQGAYTDPRVDQLLQRLEQAEQRNFQRSYQRTTQSIEEWARDKEFFDDLRDDMADFHELAHKKGQAMTFDQSYAAALSLPQHAELRQILEQRKEAEAAKTALENAQRTRQAASSIRGSPVAPLQNGSPGSLRAALEANFDAAFAGR